MAPSERIDDKISLLDVHTNVVDLNDDVDCLVMETDVNVHVDAHVIVNDQPFYNSVLLTLSAVISDYLVRCWWSDDLMKQMMMMMMLTMKMMMMTMTVMMTTMKMMMMTMKVMMTTMKMMMMTMIVACM